MVEAKTGAERKLIDYRKDLPRPYNARKVSGNVWNFPRVRFRMREYENHPTQKPIKLIERLILTSSNEGDRALDPFGGSGSTMISSERLGRDSYTVEMDGRYVAEMERRYREEMSNTVSRGNRQRVRFRRLPDLSVKRDVRR